MTSEHGGAAAGRDAWLRRRMHADEGEIPSEDLLSFAAGELRGAERERVRRLLDERPELRAALEAVAGSDSRLAGASPASPASNGALERSRATRRWLALAAAVLLIAVPVLILSRPGAERGGARTPEDWWAAAAPWTSSWGPTRSAADAGSSFEILAPRERLLSLRPELAWCAPEGGEEFAVRVEADDGALLFERRTRERRLAWPAAVAELAPGGQYRVAVEIERGPRRTVSEWFTCLDAAERGEIGEQLAEADALPRPLDVLERARLLARAGLRAEAAAALEGWARSLDAARLELLHGRLERAAAGDVSRQLRLRLSAGSD